MFEGNYYFKERQYDTDELLPLIEHQLNEGLSYWGKTSVINELENNFKERFNLKYCFTVSSGTAALNTSFFAMDIQEDDEIICCSYGYWAILSAVFAFRAKLILIDSDLNGNIKLESIKEKITQRTKAVILTHSFGYPNTELHLIATYLKSQNIYLIEDCSQSFFSEYKNLKVGSFGDIVVWSLQERKLISGGEGGVIAFTNEETYQLALLYSHNRVRTLNEVKNEKLKKYNYSGTGNHFRLSAINALIANNQLSKIDDYKKNKLYYAREFDIIFNKSSLLEPVFKQDEHLICSYHLYPLKVLAEKYNSESFFDLCVSNNFHSLSYGKVMSNLSNLEIVKNPILNFKNIGIEKCHFKNTDFIKNNYVFLPVPKTKSNDTEQYLQKIDVLFSKILT